MGEGQENVPLGIQLIPQYFRASCFSTELRAASCRLRSAGQQITNCRGLLRWGEECNSQQIHFQIFLYVFWYGLLSNCVNIAVDSWTSPHGFLRGILKPKHLLVDCNFSLESNQWSMFAKNSKSKYQCCCLGRKQTTNKMNELNRF